MASTAQKRKGGTVPVVLVLDGSVQATVGTYCNTVIRCVPSLSLETCCDLREADFLRVLFSALQTLHPQLQVRTWTVVACSSSAG